MTKQDKYAVVRIRWYLGNLSFKLIDTASSRKDAEYIASSAEGSEYEDVLSVVLMDDVTNVIDKAVHIDVYYIDSRLRMRKLPNIMPVTLEYVDKKTEKGELLKYNNYRRY